MKKSFITIINLAFIGVIALTACQPGAAKQVSNNTPSTETKALAVESFIADMAQNVAGERIKIDTLMPIGIDPHAFEPTPQDVAKISDSRILIVNGAGFEEWLDEVIANAGGKRTLIEAAAGLQSRTAGEGEEAEISPEEKAEELCAALTEQPVKEEKQAGTDVNSAAELHHEHESGHEHEAELLSLKLNKQTDGSFAGYVRLDVEEEGDTIIAAGPGKLRLTTVDSKPVEIEGTLTLNCAGINQALIAELAPGEYLLELNSFQSETTPLLAGPATGHHHHHEGDPHFWLDPVNVIKYTENIRDGLIQADPAGKEIYTQNAANYIDKLKELDQFIRQEVSAIPPEKRMIVTNHESFGYFADRYGFKIIGTIIPSVSTNASPSAQQLARLIDHIKEAKATAIFLETGSNPNLAEQITQETGIKVVSELFTHSITEAGGKAPTYIDMMKYNVKAIVDALK
jgi:manganese/iron transport system substrate-binding protein